MAFGSAFDPPAPPSIDDRLARLVEAMEAVVGLTRPGPTSEVAARTAYRDATGEIAYIVETDEEGQEIRVGTVVRNLAGEIDRVEYHPAAP